MLMHLQKYNPQVKYKVGTEMMLADILSRAYLLKVNASEYTRELEEVDHRAGLSVTRERWQQLRNASADDPVQQTLRGIILRGWSESKQEVPYFDVCHKLQDELIFKGQQLVVPSALRTELLEKTHASHIGIEGFIRRARDPLFWPRMSTEIQEYIAKCDICIAHGRGQAKEPMMQHEFMAHPWAKVAADLCDFDG